MTVSTLDVTDQLSPSTLNLRRLHGAAVVRILFGVIWTIDATFKWLPGFIHGQTLDDELGAASQVHTPVIHQWIELWHSVGTAHPGAFAVGTAVIETGIALCVLSGAFTNVVFIGSAIFSFGIWSAAEGFHLPWSKSGITDLGPSVGYIAASLALYFAAAGATWSLDGWLRPRLGRLAWLSSRVPAPAPTPALAAS
jgi:nitrite reductase (NO-forming)